MMIQAKTVTLSRDTTPNTVQVRRGDIVVFHAANADVVLCFDHAAFFGAYRYALARGTTLPLVVQGHAPLGATRYSVKFDDLTVECFPRSLVEGEIQISRLSAPQPAPPLEPQPAPPLEPPLPPSPLPTPPERLVEIRLNEPLSPPGLDNLIPGEKVTFHAIDTDATVCMPKEIFGVAVIQIDNGATSIQIVQNATPGDFTYQIDFVITDECDRGEEGEGSMGGRD